MARAVERAVLVGIDTGNLRQNGATIGADESLRELERLARTAGVEPIATLTQNLRQISPATYIGKGKVEELKDLVKSTGANVVLFDENLSPGQQRTLTERVEAKVLDRSQLILDIFAAAGAEPRRQAAGGAGAARVHAAAPDARLDALVATRRRRCRDARPG